ncbi:triose-phosphate isomerase [Patescibacteria group bacterium]|nr:triose-phosphate isomerase [Patescibacteria group bacterium]
MARKRLVVGNWKSYIESPSEAHALALALRRKARALPGVEVWLAPPYPLLPAVAEVLESSPIKVGAQALSASPGGKHTGEVSANMLKQVGAQFALVGHSERRAQGEGDEQVRAQLLQALQAKLTAVLCVGEHERLQDGSHFSFIERQLVVALDALPPKAKVIVAYEPVWAIGKSAEEAMQPQDLEQMAIFIRKTLVETLDRSAGLKIPILYGGSVESANTHALLIGGGVNGFLVGHASVEAEPFLEIIKACK